MKSVDDWQEEDFPLDQLDRWRSPSESEKSGIFPDQQISKVPPGKDSGLAILRIC